MPGPVEFNTPRRIVEQAMRNAGLLQKGQKPTSTDFAEYVPVLNDMINFRQTSGLKLWLNIDLPVPMQVGVSRYLLGPSGVIITTRPTRILDDGYYLDANQISRPVFIIARQEWDQLSTRTQQGPITQFFVDKQQNNLVLNLWLTPDANAVTGVLHLIAQQQVGNVVQVNDQMNFPLEWFIALHWGLSDEICTGQPQAIMDRCKERAQFYWDKLDEWDVEDASTKFQIDNKGSQGGGFT